MSILLTSDMNVNRLGFVFWTPAGICATVVHSYWFYEQVGHHTVIMWVIFNADLRQKHTVIMIRAGKKSWGNNKKSLYGLSRNYCTSLASEEHINVSESIISLPFSHTGLQHWSTEVSFIRQRSSKGWPALTVTLETSSFLLTSVSRSETQIRASSYTTNLTVRYFLSYYLLLLNYFLWYD